METELKLMLWRLLSNKEKMITRRERKTIERVRMTELRENTLEAVVAVGATVEAAPTDIRRVIRSITKIKRKENTIKIDTEIEAETKEARVERRIEAETGIEIEDELIS
jgi:hypothetical protein